MIEEIRIDCLHQSAEELEKAKELRQDIFRLNHTLPDTEEYRKLLHKVFPNLGENCRVETPFSGVRAANVRFGRNVIIMPGCLMMSAGGITIDDDVQIAANVQLISNNHDLEKRHVITCKPVHICRKVWIGAGATILPGVTVGENAVVGAGSVVTHDVKPNTIVTGNPARLIREIRSQSDGSPSLK